MGLPSRTVRYYDRIGLVTPPRGDQGYRMYGPEDEAKLRFVCQAKALGFTLEDIRGLISAAEHGSCGEVVPEIDRLLDEKLAQIDEQMHQLARFRDRLVTYRSNRAGGCGCTGHGAFCGCLDDAPFLTIQPRRS